MKNNEAKLHQALDRGICTGCDHVQVCRLHRKEDRPVFFCEEFACAPAISRRPGTKIYSLPGCYEGRIAVRSAEQARRSYIGLCRTCAKLSVCPLLKPGGGTWQCGSYEKDSTC
jgi:hypothetical protein